jgi:hypothetical protein
MPADLEVDFSRFRIPECHRCGGILQPDAPITPLLQATLKGLTDNWP